MSSTPRKKRNHTHNPQHNSSSHAHPLAQGHQRTRSQYLAAEAAVSANQITSDYESDTASYMANHQPPNLGLAQRSNNEINMTVLKRYIPSVTCIQSIASNAVVYTFDSSSDAGGFEKANVEGPLFTCQLSGSDLENCVFILNRKTTDNLRLDLANVTNFELQGDMLYIQSTGPEGEPKVWGLYIHDSPDNRRDTHTKTIMQLWQATQEAGAMQEKMAVLAAQQGSAAHGVPLSGNQININDLFKR